MDIKLWIIGQIGVDIIMVVVLVWVIVSAKKQRGSDAQESPDLERPEALVSEIKEITGHLEQNLEQKRELSRRVIGRLDEVLARAEEKHQQLSLLLEKAETVSRSGRVRSGREPDKAETVRGLLDRGMTKQEAARHLGISVGEIDLLLKLGNREAGGRDV
ncbi:MAG: hypothetical protein ACLFUP_01655 [Desulfobacteraceae bacterium]